VSLVKSSMLFGAVGVVTALAAPVTASAHPRQDSRVYRAAARLLEAPVQAQPGMVAPVPARRFSWVEIEAVRAFERMR
jgi:hypothetical protein